MRIIAGEFRRRLLVAPPGLSTRPLPDRVKESMFSMLGERIKDAAVVDLFAGSGSFGLEAISRGARSCLFVDRDMKALDALEQNVTALKCQERARVVKGDALGLAVAARCPRPADIIFLDPPYPLMLEPDGVGWARVKQQAEALVPLLADDGFLILRSPWPFFFLDAESHARFEAMRSQVKRERHVHSSAENQPRGGRHSAAPRPGRADAAVDSDEEDRVGRRGGKRHREDDRPAPAKGRQVAANDPFAGKELDAEFFEGEELERLMAELEKAHTRPPAGAAAAKEADGDEGEDDAAGDGGGSVADEHQPVMTRIEADLTLAGARGPETHAYGKTAVHWYMKR
ncbi:MAG: 16S rRNA (guanine(966)-N(2))-methyltransferase RsmD [Planctomycetaceae bacterium]|jgi:16S rRNA G966 N2-methylase RsmD|nr:16S rRNA (guanine(966)-N(2))-methyltransferase RsmD [Phycisphaerales bacterium]MCE2652893.1 16S rRNA (guanine(966)-N(2))-methyltransferase RsmD [Planctomycetaceae bacterium]